MSPVLLQIRQLMRMYECAKMSPFSWGFVYLLTSNTKPAFVSTLNELPLVVTPKAASTNLAKNSPARVTGIFGDLIANTWTPAHAQR